MLVILKNNWRTPQGRFDKSPSADMPTEIPDELAKFLPSTAVIVKGGPKVKLAPVEPTENGLHLRDLGRAQGEAENALNKTAEDAIAESKKEAARARMAHARASRKTPKLVPVDPTS